MEGEILTESENYFGKDEKLSYRDIVLRQFQKVVNNMSKEMIVGYWIYSMPAPNVTPFKSKYIGDSREELVNSLNCLYDICQPKFDKDMKEKSEEIYKGINTLEAKSKEKQNSFLGKPLLKQYRKLFQQLCFFLDRLNWFKSEKLED